MLKRLSFIFLLTVLIVPPLMSQSRGLAVDLNQYRWQNRILLIFAPDRTSPAYQKQLEELNKQMAGVQDRDLIIFHLFSRDTSFFKNKKLSAAASSQLYQEYGIAESEYLIILIGKDGTEKLRQSGSLSIQKLFSVIDAMPMRQQEMQQE